MKKIVLLLFTTVVLSSCSSYMGDTASQHWIVSEIKKEDIRNSNNAIYTVVSYDSEGYRYEGFKFKGQNDKFQVGDTVELVKIQY